MRILACMGSLAVGAAVTFGATTAAAEDTPKEYGACTRKPTTGDTSAAKGAFQAGQAAFNEADYGRAITYWEDAFRRDCTANPLLLNLARSYELDGQKRHAVLALQTFLDRSPGSSEEGQIKRRIEKLNDQIAAENAAQASATATTTTTTGTGTTTGAGTPGAGSTDPMSTGGVQPTATPDAGKKKRSPVPLIAVGGGALIAAIGAGVYVSAQSTISDVEAKCPTRRNCVPASLADEGNAARTRATIGGVMLGVGAVGIAGGLIWYFTQPTQPAATAMKPLPRGLRAGIRPDIGAGYNGLSVVGQF